MYAVAILVTALGSSVFLFLVFPFVQVFRKTEFFLLSTSFVLNLGSNFIAVYMIKWLCGLLRMEPTLLMVLIPLILTITNGLKRIRKTKKELGAAEKEIPEGENENSPDEGLSVKNEYSMLSGDVAGLIAGIYYFLKYAPFI